MVSIIVPLEGWDKVVVLQELEKESQKLEAELIAALGQKNRLVRLASDLTREIGLEISRESRLLDQCDNDQCKIGEFWQ